MSRTKKSAKNIVYNLLNVFLNLVLMFGVRTLFIETLGVTYLGLNGVFKNIFQFMSLAELGIGSAISYRLYQPLNDNNERRIAALMLFFRKAYNIISIAITVMSLALVPFIGGIIGDPDVSVNIYLVYAIYVFQTLSTYLFFAYKITLLQADQREYIVSKYGNYIVIATSITEIAILYFFQSFIGYLLVLIFFNIFKNYLVARRVDKDYPYLYDYDEKIDKEELREMFKDFFAAFLYRINGVVLNSTDNLVLTYFVGLNIVGFYSNYVLITANLKKFIRPFLNSIKASLGSFIAQKSKEESYHLFQMINVLSVILYGGSSIGLFILSNRFIRVWIGDDFTLSLLFVFLISFEFYLRGMQLFLSQIRNAMGLFQQLKYRPLMSIVINLVLSVLLVQQFGIEGVILGTILASVTTNMIFDPKVIHDYGFGRSSRIYYLKNTYYIVLVSATGAAAHLLTRGLPENLLGLLASFVITAIVIVVGFAAGFSWLREFRELVQRMVKFVKNKT